MFLGSDAVLLDGMELGSQPTGLRLPDLQPVAGPPAASGPPRAQPPHLANKPPPAPRRRPSDHLPPAVLRFLHSLGAHGTDAEPGGESPPPSLGQSPPPTARRPVPRCRARPHLAPGLGAGPLTSESQKHCFPSARRIARLEPQRRRERLRERPPGLRGPARLAVRPHPRRALTVAPPLAQENPRLDQ